MMKLGEKQQLMIAKQVDFGVYLAEREGDAEKVLLPKRQVPEGAKIGDTVTVFLYKDSMDRLIATTNEPALTLGEVAALKILELGQIGAFLDWGLEKALFYEFSGNFGTFVAVDDKYSAMIPSFEDCSQYKIGDVIEAKVSNVKADGKLDLTLREKAYIQMDADAQKILQIIERYGGALPFNDKASPEVIKKEAQMSKNAFKRAVGRLYKERKIEITETGIKLK